jgi:uncharacterized protein (TIGR01732 family)
MITLRRASIIEVSVVSLTTSRIALAAQPYDGWWHFRAVRACQAEADCVPCVGAALMIEEKDPETGAPVRVRLGNYSAERTDGTIVVRHDSEVILTLEVPEDLAEGGDFVALAGAVKTLTDICLLNPKDYAVFESFVYAIVIPNLVALGLSYDALALDDGYAGGFVLILMLFILLVIIGAGFGLGS